MRITKKQISDLVVFAPEGHPSPQKYIEAVHKSIMKTDKDGNPRPIEDFMYFLQVSNRAKLDPTLKQIYPVYRWDSKQNKEVMTIQAGIDGLRATAESTGKYAGSDDAKFEYKGVQIVSATITVYKLNPITGDRMPFTASARWSEYKPLPPNDMMWNKMPHVMLAKCAEALALRKAFPIISGIYIEEEMEQSSRLTPALAAVSSKVELDENSAKEIEGAKTVKELIEVCQRLKSEKGERYHDVLVQFYTARKSEIESAESEKIAEEADMALSGKEENAA